MVLAPLMHVHADAQHERSALPIRRGVRERAGDLSPLELDVVRPF